MKKFKIILFGVVIFGLVGVVITNNFQKKEFTPSVELENESKNDPPINVNSFEDELLETKLETIVTEDTKLNSNTEPDNENNVSLSDSNKPVENKKADGNTSKKDKNSSSKDANTKKDTQVVNEVVASDKTQETSKEEVKVQEPKEEETVKDNTYGKPVPFYESITHGEKEFYTENEALNRGLEIAKNELNYVMDYNEQHPDAQISPDINYYRVYPSFVDENGHTWYYLHFFCQSGDANDKKLKSMY